MEEESDSRKINNSFLRDHNYATEGIWKIELNSIITYINDGGGSSSGPLLFVNVHWALVLVGALRILRPGDLKSHIHAVCILSLALCEVHCALDHMILQGTLIKDDCHVFIGLGLLYIDLALAWAQVLGVIMGQWPLRYDVHNESGITGITEPQTFFLSDY